MTGKLCPKYFVDHQEAWTQFKADVAAAMAGETKKSGWYEENGSWRYYNGDTGDCVCNKWAEVDDKWYWFDGAGMIVTNVWDKYNGSWYYLGSDGALKYGAGRADRWSQLAWFPLSSE